MPGTPEASSAAAPSNGQPPNPGRLNLGERLKHDNILGPDAPAAAKQLGQDTPPDAAPQSDPYALEPEVPAAADRSDSTVPNPGASDETVIVELDGVEQEIPRSELAKRLSRLSEAEQQAQAAQMLLKKYTHLEALDGVLQRLDPEDHALFREVLANPKKLRQLRHGQSAADADGPLSEEELEGVLPSPKRTAPAAASDERLDRIESAVLTLAKREQEREVDYRRQSMMDTVDSTIARVPILKGNPDVAELARQDIVTELIVNPGANQQQIEQIVMRHARKYGELLKNRPARQTPSTPAAQLPRSPAPGRRSGGFEAGESILDGTALRRAQQMLDARLKS